MVVIERDGAWDHYWKAGDHSKLVGAGLVPGDGEENQSLPSVSRSSEPMTSASVTADAGHRGCAGELSDQRRLNPWLNSPPSSVSLESTRLFSQSKATSLVTVKGIGALPPTEAAWP